MDDGGGVATLAVVVAATAWAVPDKVDQNRLFTEEYEHVDALVPEGLSEPWC